ncbi:unnamed protein product [marine sediment metagenome]|uniref:NusG-like N-terminal domain-containing protein n=1 Tax=marine sediment metagenome TaxID=412755 RepID=X0V9L2_9ZZZZ
MDKSAWYVWTISANRYKKVREFVDKISEIKDILYPLAEKEYSTRSGVKVKEVPLYVNYLFIRYEHSSKIAAELEKCPWIHNCLGPCSQGEIKKVRELNRSKYEDIMPADKLQIGMQIKLIGTVFKGMIATLIGIDGNKLAVSIRILGGERTIKCSIDDIEM